MAEQDISKHISSVLLSHSCHSLWRRKFANKKFEVFSEAFFPSYKYGLIKLESHVIRLESITTGNTSFANQEVQQHYLTFEKLVMLCNTIYNQLAGNQQVNLLHIVRLISFLLQISQLPQFR